MIILAVRIRWIQHPISVDDKFVGVLAGFQIYAANPFAAFAAENILRFVPVVKGSCQDHNASIRITFQPERSVAFQTRWRENDPLGRVVCTFILKSQADKLAFVIFIELVRGAADFIEQDRS